MLRFSEAPAGLFQLSAFGSNLSNEYSVSTITALDKAGSISLGFNLIQGIPVEVKFIYNDFNPSASSISSFQPWFMVDSIANIQTDFRDINF